MKQNNVISQNRPANLVGTSRCQLFASLTAVLTAAIVLGPLVQEPQAFSQTAEAELTLILPFILHSEWLPTF